MSGTAGPNMGPPETDCLAEIQRLLEEIRQHIMYQEERLLILDFRVQDYPALKQTKNALEQLLEATDLSTVKLHLVKAKYGDLITRIYGPKR